MGRLNAEQRTRLAALSVGASQGSAELHPDLAHEQLRAVRLAAGASLSEMGRVLECNRGTLANHEKAAYQIRLSAAIRLLEYCGYRVLIEKIEQ